MKQVVHLARRTQNKLWIQRSAWMVILLAPMFSTLLHAGFEGFGSSTPGGNNGSLVKVTSLADSGPGTLREVLTRGNNQRIEFAVGGIILLQNRLEIRGQSFVTIDGSTAPAPGITLERNSLYIRNSHDIIVSHIRVRNPITDGILVGRGSHNVVIDHCSVTNAGDENINITESTHSVTVSWCIIGDTRPDSFALKTKGMLIANFKNLHVTNVSIHHNLFIKQFQRSPQISTAGIFDVRNNVIRDWGAYGMRIRSGARANIINNSFSTNNNPEKAIVFESDVGALHVQGNQGPGSIDVNSLSTTSNAFPVAQVTTHSVTEVEQSVLKRAGASPRDAIDTLLARPPAAQSPTQSRTMRH
jgi:pectate lyase